MSPKRIAIANVQVPFVRGGSEALAESLRVALLDRGFQAEVVTIPFKWHPAAEIVKNALAWRMLDLNEADGQTIDLVIALRFPAYCVPHENKVLWLLHQHRQAYELWGTPLGGLENDPDGPRIREFIRHCDERFIGEAKEVYAISSTVSDRLSHYNKLSSAVLYPPSPLAPLLGSGDVGDYILCPSRLSRAKRQDRLIEAMSLVRSDVRVVVTGEGPDADRLERLVRQHSLENKVQFLGYLPSEEMARAYRDCLAVFFGPYQEDYGYVTIEAFLAHKPVVTFSDSGGPLEFVRHGETGFVVPPDDLQSLASRLDDLYLNHMRTKEMGEAAHKVVLERDITWDRVVETLVK